MKILGLGPERIKGAISSGEVTMAVYGLGKLGLPLAAVFASKGARVIGVDKDPRKLEMLRRGENPYPWEPGLSELLDENRDRMAFTGDPAEGASLGDVHVVIIPSSLRRGVFDYTPFGELAEAIAGGLEKGDIVITETTLPPGTTERFGKDLSRSGLEPGRDFGLAHAPERTSSGTMIRDITRMYPKIVGASDPMTLEAVTSLYSLVNEKGVIPVSSIRTAEAVKVFEGIYRDVNIALANELAIYSEIMGIDVYEAIRAANTQPYCNIHIPSAGVGGHCIPVYPYFLLQDYDSRLIREARRVNDSMPKHVVELSLRILNSEGKAARGSRILVLGVAYRGNVGSIENSPATPIIRALRGLGAEVLAWDPMVEDEVISQMGARPVGGLVDADLVIILASHRVFEGIDLEGIKAPVIDARASLEKHPRTMAPGKLYKDPHSHPVLPR